MVVAIGPNDLAWTDLLRYCYAVANCQDRLTQGEFDYRLAAFDRDYGNLLQDLNDLPDRPQIIIVTSYDVFNPDANCTDAQGPARRTGSPRATSTLLTHRNAELNDVLDRGREEVRLRRGQPAAESAVRDPRATSSAPTSRASPTRIRSTPPESA